MSLKLRQTATRRLAALENATALVTAGMTSGIMTERQSIEELVVRIAKRFEAYLDGSERSQEGKPGGES